MSTLPKVSIIVPVYNVEKYLQQCLESIINQTLTEIEIICINDGSTDCSTEILRAFAQKDSRIKLIEKENAGYGAAMNTGILRATGEYIGIVESDDFIETDMFQVLYENALKYPRHPDIVKAGYCEYRKTRNTESIKAAAIMDFSPVVNPFTIYDNPALLYYHPCTVTAIYRRKFLVEKGIAYKEVPGASWTDNLFFFMTLCQAESIVWVKKCLYYYRQDNMNSSSYLKDCTIPFLRLAEIFDFINEKGIRDQGVLTALYKRVFLYLNGILLNPFYKKESVRPLIKNVMQRINPQFIKESNFNRLERYYYKCFLSDSYVLMENNLFRKFYIRFLPERVHILVHSIGEYGFWHTFKRILYKLRKCLSQ